MKSELELLTTLLIVININLAACKLGKNIIKKQQTPKHTSKKEYKNKKTIARKNAKKKT